MINKKPAVYFITDGEYIKIGKAVDLIERIRGMQSGNPKKLIALAVIEVLETSLNAEEKKAHKYFKNYRLKNNFNREWFSKDILPLIDEYVKDRKGKIIDKAVELINRTKKTTKNRWTINTLWGPENLDRTRPRCYFYPEHQAQITGHAGPGENYRKMMWKGKKLYISQKKHQENIEMRKIFKNEYTYLSGHSSVVE